MNDIHGTDVRRGVEEVVRELVRDKGNVVYEWPDDEAAAYRDNGGFSEGMAAVEDVRTAKGTDAIMALLDQPSGSGRIVRELEARLAEAQSAERNSDGLRRERYAGQVTGLKTALSIARTV